MPFLTGHFKKLESCFQSSFGANLGAWGQSSAVAPAKKRGRGRTVVLPVPSWLAKLARRLGDFRSINKANNDNGRTSAEFIEWLKLAGIDPLPQVRRGRTFHVKSFHSFRHAMTSRLAAAGVSGEIARLVTDHDSPQVMRSYVHAEISSLAEALKKARRK